MTVKKKVCMLGTFAVGKTSLVSRFVHGVFSERYQTTIGVKIDAREVRLDSRDVTLVLWDLNGEDAFQRVRDSYLRGSAGCVLVADGTRPDTLEPALELHRRAVALVGEIPTLLLANKSDLRAEWALPDARLQELAAAGWRIERTSAASGAGVAEAFTWLAERLLAASTGEATREEDAAEAPRRMRSVSVASTPPATSSHSVASAAPDLDAPPALARALAGLGKTLLQRRAPDAFVLLGEAPPWLSLPPDAERGSSVPRAALPAFLQPFLEEVEAELWTQDAPPGSRLSGPWIERAAGRDWPLHAEARRLPDGAALLLLESLDASWDEQRTALQAARSSLLAFQQLRREIESKELLLHCIVHDLKGPLATILGSLTLLQRRHAEDERSSRLLELGLLQARRQEDMIRQVLEVFAAEVSALEDFATDAARAPDAAALAARVARRVQPAFESRGVELRTRPSPWDARPAPVVGDAARLERVLSNLLENALRHSPPEGRVTLSLEREPSAVLLAVEDEGEGVDPSVAETLFEKFGHGANGGTAGLGLYFCRRTVESWGGAVGHAPARPRGARFWVRLLAPRD